MRPELLAKNAILKLRLRGTLGFGSFLAPLLLLHLLANTLPDTYHKWIRGAPSDLPKRSIKLSLRTLLHRSCVTHVFHLGSHLVYTNHGQPIGMDRAYMVTDEQSP